MKILVLLTILAISTLAQAANDPRPQQKIYSFVFRMNNEIYEYAQNANTYEDAFDKAAQACFDYFKGNQRLSEEKGLDIIDVCANPRKS